MKSTNEMTAKSRRSCTKLLSVTYVLGVLEYFKLRSTCSHRLRIVWRIDLSRVGPYGGFVETATVLQQYISMCTINILVLGGVLLQDS